MAHQHARHARCALTAVQSHGSSPAELAAVVCMQIQDVANSALPLTGVSFTVDGNRLCAACGPKLYVLDAFSGEASRPCVASVVPCHRKLLCS